ncbi:MAG: hypothetical protein GEU81_04000 [Nitriliruptorales bacterium]|nr:hypothetical protein [Nitriliruptorales bacterium]
MTSASRWRTWPRTLILLLLTTVGGCRVGVDIGLEADRDGSGALTVGMRADAEALQRGAAAGADPLEPLVKAGERLRDEGWSLRDRTDDLGNRQVQLATRFADPAELTVLAADLGEALAGPEGRPLESLDLVVTEHRVRVEATAALQPTDAVTEYGLSPEQVVELLRERQAIDYRVRVTLPGEVLEHNGTLVEGGTLEWRIPPGERVDIRVEGLRPTGPDWLLVLLGAAIVVNALVLVGLLVAERRRRRRRPGVRTQARRQELTLSCSRSARIRAFSRRT